ncbi:hypothetical protein CDAR_620151 [Caerostris darwini]|uniref:Uncharacterized protein n=1 Tax=Caerostris darwini TaxID=1538125 RepID=A0AAV4Q5B1_9ARAC|nr:hypothetical protein CDAR_620151 [Caerostris darwini]
MPPPFCPSMVQEKQSFYRMESRYKYEQKCSSILFAHAYLRRCSVEIERKDLLVLRGVISTLHGWRHTRPDIKQCRTSSPFCPQWYKKNNPFIKRNPVINMNRNVPLPITSTVFYRNRTQRSSRPKGCHPDPAWMADTRGLT